MRICIAFALTVAVWPVPLARADDTFEKIIRPILADHCLRCHGKERQRGGLRLDSRESLLAGGETGPAIVVGKPDESLLMKAVRHQDDQMMPPEKEKKLGDAQVTALAAWVTDGAKWPGGAGVAGATRYKPGRIGPEEKAWWAFQPIRKSTDPKASIDHFIRARRDAAGLSAALAADKRVLIRRVTYDLVGLPPTRAEIEAFVEDPSTNAYEQLVDTLLARPEYGERQARLWLDLVRYADSDGYRHDTVRPHAFVYRDYVIRSFNRDAPYDRFVQEQLAGDEMFPDSPDALRATGYLRLWQYEYNQRDVRGQWAVISSDLTDVTADAFLGLGMGCARCHDHKFDPLLQKDYYQLQSFFASLDFKDEPVFDSPAAKAGYEKALAAWTEKTAAIAKSMDAMLEAIREKETTGAIRKFPTDIAPIFRKPAAERTVREKQLHDLAYRQVQYEYDQAESKLSADQKGTYAALKKDLDALGAKPSAPVAMIARDVSAVPAETMMPGKKGAAVEPAFPTIFDPQAPTITPSATSTGRRTALAKWLTTPGNPLTARVMVNRLWQQHFGKGLVATPSDFGKLGEPPSHPELLDWLASEFTSHGWSIKHMHRLMVLSATYRMAPSHPDIATAKLKDPEGRLLWKMPIRRLEAEQVRDAMLITAGDLKQEPRGGPSVDTNKPVRSVYTRQMRNVRDPLLQAFDAADGLTSCACRNTTTTATQSLLLLNGPDVTARSATFAKRLMQLHPKDADARVKFAYALAYGRRPTAEEQRQARDFLNVQANHAPGPDAELAACTDFCHVLLNSSEFLYVD